MAEDYIDWARRLVANWHSEFDETPSSEDSFATLRGEVGFALELARRLALEEAARLCDHEIGAQHPLKPIGVTTHIEPAAPVHAVAIRALKNQPSPDTGGKKRPLEPYPAPGEDW